MTLFTRITEYIPLSFPSFLFLSGIEPRAHRESEKKRLLGSYPCIRIFFLIIIPH